jgi:hypothetical protein
MKAEIMRKNIGSEIDWGHVSSKEGDLPNPAGFHPQTGALVVNFDARRAAGFVIIYRVQGSGSHLVGRIPRAGRATPSTTTSWPSRPAARRMADTKASSVTSRGRRRRRSGQALKVGSAQGRSLAEQWRGQGDRAFR